MKSKSKLNKQLSIIFVHNGYGIVRETPYYKKVFKETFPTMAEAVTYKKRYIKDFPSGRRWYE